MSNQCKLCGGDLNGVRKLGCGDSATHDSPVVSVATELSIEERSTAPIDGSERAVLSRRT
jgi:hypothetical protein